LAGVSQMQAVVEIEYELAEASREDGDRRPRAKT
jgi:hypothetical protein